MNNTCLGCEWLYAEQTKNGSALAMCTNKDGMYAAPGHDYERPDWCPLKKKEKRE